MCIQLQFCKQPDKFELKPLDLVVDFVKTVKDASDFVWFSLGEVIVALQGLQLL